MPPASRERVLVRRVTDLELAVSEALDFLDWDFQDKKVWVKPNILSDQPPERSVTTDPELVRHCVRGLKDRGAARVWVGDNPGGTYTGHMAEFTASTMIPAASEGHFVDVSTEPRTLTLESRYVPQVSVSHQLFEADLILNLPVLKTHGLTIITGAIKNTFGIVTGKQKSLLHGKARSAAQFSELLVDIFQAIPVPVLSIMDALRGMDGMSGPSSGRVRNIGRLLTSRNAVALDSVFARMAGTEPARIPMLYIAGERGLGPTGRGGIEVVGDFERIRGFQLPVSVVANAAAFVSGHYFTVARSRPLLKPKLCTECRQCEESCPVQAITMSPLPVIDRKTCIACYCCVEICPAHALVVDKGLRALWDRVSGR